MVAVQPRALLKSHVMHSMYSHGYGTVTVTVQSRLWYSHSHCTVTFTVQSRLQNSHVYGTVTVTVQSRSQSLFSDKVKCWSLCSEGLCAVTIPAQSFCCPKSPSRLSNCTASLYAVSHCTSHFTCSPAQPQRCQCQHLFPCARPYACPHAGLAGAYAVPAELQEIAEWLNRSATEDPDTACRAMASSILQSFYLAQ